MNAPLYLVATPLGNLADFTPRAVEILKSVDVVACEDTRHSRILFDHYGLSPQRVVSYHAHNIDRMTPKLAADLADGRSVALVTDAGTPGISDPGAALVRAAVEAGGVVIPIPGPSAPVLAVAASGFPSHRFVYEGFIPRKKGRQTMLKSWSDEPRTIVFFESPMRIVKTLKDIKEFTGDRWVCVARELTKKFEEFVRGPVDEVIAALESRGSVKGEITVVVAPPGFTLGKREERWEREE
jgi:16S rRNA (cytidine1402-2'-O)-methyltransferase